MLILSTHNILSPSNGRPVTVPIQDMVLGLHYMTKIRCGEAGEGIVFSSTQEVITAFQMGQVALHATIKLRIADGNELLKLPLVVCCCLKHCQKVQILTGSIKLLKRVT